MRARLLAPIRRFLAIEAASGILLLVAAVLALAWANSPWRDGYAALWHTPIGMHVGSLGFERSVHFWINDGAMTVFFLTVGVEIRREIHSGQLRDMRRAMLPLAAASGGMLVPAALYVAFNAGHESISGWGVPMATDIAFAVGVLTLLGNRVPPALRVLLLALAVIDDVGAIVVIAVFYSSELALGGFVVLAVGLAIVWVMRRSGVRNPWAYVPAGIVAWAGAYAGGIHPTLVGVVLGLMVPVDAVEGERCSPLERIETSLHGWVAFGVMPVFALANAGVALGDAAFVGEPGLVFAGVIAGLLVGKPVGVLAVSWAAVRAGLAALPDGITWRHVALVGLVASIGFTMSIFIAELAFDGGVSLETAKVGILVASAIGGIAAYGVGRGMLATR